MCEHQVRRAGVDLSVSEAGTGVPVVLLHGLTASRRYVVMGSRTLERSGHRVVSYDARGHGRSGPAPDPSAYGYEDLTGDLLAVMDALEIERAVLAGASMGCHTILRAALEVPERVAGIVAITPGDDPDREREPEGLARWDVLADALRTGGIEGFVEAYEVERLPAAWQETMTRVLHQRLAAHEHLDAVADALQAVPRSRPFAGMGALEAISAPAVVVGSRDEPDPGHPEWLARRYAEHLPGSRFLLEEEGTSPIAWRGGRLSEVIAELAAEAW